MTNSRAQIVATIGPASENEDILLEMIKSGVDVIRFNMSWANTGDHLKHLKSIIKIEKQLGRKIPVIMDLPGPRIQKGREHTYNKEAVSSITEKDEEFIKFGIENVVDYFAVSFVGDSSDVSKCREVVKKIRRSAENNCKN